MVSAPVDLLSWTQFRANDVIDALAPLSRWTVSGRLDDDPATTSKAPIDIRQLLDLTDPTGRRVRGAWSTDGQCLITLDELADRLPDAANAAFYLNSPIDGCLVVDIEPGCPPSLAADLRAMPGILYAELSMSGRGYHLVMPRPANLADHPVAARKAVLRETHGWFELLFTHWVTFTRRPIPASAPQIPGTPTFTLEDIFADLAATAHEQAGSASDVDIDEDPGIPGADIIVEWTADDAATRLASRGPGDFSYDMSRYEFSVLGILYTSLDGRLRELSALGTTYSGSERAWLLYRCAVEVLEHRPKHDELRNNRPYLLERAASIVADRLARADDPPRD